MILFEGSIIKGKTGKNFDFLDIFAIKSICDIKLQRDFFDANFLFGNAEAKLCLKKI